MTDEDLVPAAHTERIDYGRHVEQHLEISLPPSVSTSATGTVALLHGGYWRSQFTSELMQPMAADLHHRGWAVANVEYRRVGAGGGWPAPLSDAVTACLHLADMVRSGRLPSPLVLLGHSVGGQLALLAARRLPRTSICGVLALAPVTDVLETWRTGLGENAADELFAEIGARESVAADASPKNHLPLGVPITIIHGRDDARVPHAHSAEFAGLATAAGDRVRLLSPSALEHRAAIDPAHHHWPGVVAELESLAFSQPRPADTGA